MQRKEGTEATRETFGGNYGRVITMTNSTGQKSCIKHSKSSHALSMTNKDCTATTQCG